MASDDGDGSMFTFHKRMNVHELCNDAAINRELQLVQYLICPFSNEKSFGLFHYCFFCQQPQVSNQNEYNIIIKIKI